MEHAFDVKSSSLGLSSQNLFFCLWTSNCSSSLFWKGYPSSTELLLHLCQKSIGHLCESISGLLSYGSFLTFKNNLIYFLFLSLWKISQVCTKAENSTVNPQDSSSFNDYHPSLFHHHLFEESSAVFLHIISRSEFVSHGVICLVLVPPVFPINWQSGPRSLINSGYAFVLLHHEETHYVGFSVLVVLHFSWLRGKCQPSPLLKYIFPFIIIK